MSNFENEENIATCIHILEKTNLNRDLLDEEKFRLTVEKLDVIQKQGISFHNFELKNDENTSNSILRNYILYENRLVDIKWKILLEEKSSSVSVINMLKIHINLTYFNMNSKNFTNICMVMKEEKFLILLDEISKLNNYFVD